MMTIITMPPEGKKEGKSEEVMPKHLLKVLLPHYYSAVSL